MSRASSQWQMGNGGRGGGGECSLVVCLGLGKIRQCGEGENGEAIRTAQEAGSLKASGISLTENNLLRGERGDRLGIRIRLEPRLDVICCCWAQGGDTCPVADADPDQDLLFTAGGVPSGLLETRSEWPFPRNR